ncbi:MAG TPA: hypothetical protein VFR37_01000 [Longimicrobium sp.]|nr:hypothetical protein [Longimicrobium sp.]
MATSPRHDVARRWKRFVSALDRLLSRTPRFRHQEHFERVKREAVRLASQQVLADEIEKAYLGRRTSTAFTQVSVSQVESPQTPLAESDLPTPADLVADELEAFADAADSYERDRKEGNDEPEARTDLLAMAKTILDSVKDLFELVPWAKGALTVLKEVLEFAAAEKKPDNEDARRPKKKWWPFGWPGTSR